MFVVLVGPPGRVAKSTTIRMGRHLLLPIEEINFGPDSLTREELIRVMSRVGGRDKQSAITIHSTELSSLVEPSGIKMIQFLTDIYDSDLEWRYSTKGSGKDVIYQPCLNILAGTTPSWIAEGLPADVVGHGFTSRVVFVYEDTPRYLKPFPKSPDSELVKDLVNDLDWISRIEGEFSWGRGAKDKYEQIYQEIYSSVPKDYRIEGFHNRKRIHILKLAMVLSISESDDLEIRPVDLEAAHDLLKMTEKKMFKSFSAVGKYEYASDLERLQARIETEGEMSSEEIHNEFYAVGSVREIAEMLHMLISMGKVERVKGPKGSVFRSVT